jgi:hypothetical protein
VEPPVHDGPVHRRDPLDRRDVAEPERAERGQVEPADGLGDVRERVRVDGVAVRAASGSAPTPQASITITAARAIARRLCRMRSFAILKG